MAEISVKYRNTSRPKKCAIPSSKIVSLEIGDESPDSSSESVFTTFSCNDRLSQYGNNLIHERDDGICKDFLIHSQLSLSHTHHANQEPSTTDCEIDNELRELLLSSTKSSKSSVPLLEKNSSNSKNYYDSAKMKVNSNQAEDNLSDILTSLSTCDENLTKGKNGNISSKNDFLDGIHFSDLNFSNNICKNSESRESLDNSFFKEKESLSDLFSSLNIDDSKNRRLGKSNHINTHNVKKLDYSDCNENFSLSDMLCSINIENASTSKPIAYNGLLENSEEMDLSLKNFYYTSDSLPGLILDDAKCNSSDSCASSYSDTKDDSTAGSIVIKNSYLNDEINDSDSGISSFGSLKQEFSFFNSSETMDSFNTLLEHIDEFKNGNVCEDQQIKNNKGMSMLDVTSCVDEVKDKKLTKDHNELINKSEHCMSMLDLVKSIDFKSDTLFPDASSSSKNFVNGSSYNIPLTMSCKDTLKRMDSVNVDASNVNSMLQIEKNFLDDENNFSDDVEQITCIDLRECIKPTKNSLNSSPPFEVHEEESFECISPENLELQSYDYINPLRNFDEENNSLILHMPQSYSNSMSLIETSPLKKPKVNSEQSLFSKSLGCKHKKNPLLAMKIASIKFKLYENFMNRPMHFEDNIQLPNTESQLPLNHIQCSEQCIISHAGRKSFGIEASCELQ